MACINNGQLSPSAHAILDVLSTGMKTPQEIAAAVGQPLFKVRSGLREMAKAGLLAEADERYGLTSAGRERI